MSVTASQLSAKVVRTGHTVTIPNNDLARVMYYLQCVTQAVDMDILPDDCIEYQNYRYLSESRVDLVINFAQILSPGELINKLIFRDDEGAFIKDGMLNDFASITVACDMIHVQQSVVIGGKVQDVSKVMFFKSEWLTRNYYDPMRRLQNRREDCVIS
jgi:hypothetical protein